MSPSVSVAASLPPDIRKHLAIQVLSKTEPVSRLAAREQVSRKFLYQQKHKAEGCVAKTSDSLVGVVFVLTVARPTHPVHEHLAPQQNGVTFCRKSSSGACAGIASISSATAS